MNFLQSIREAIKNRRLEIELLKNHRSLYRQELNEFREAREAWYDPWMPTTRDMQEIYREAVKNDAHLRSVINTRIHLVLANDFALYVKDRKLDSDLLKSVWFRKKMRLDMESIFYGYTLMYPVLEGGHVVDVRPVDRGHFVPQRGKILQNPYHNEGLPLKGLEKYLWLAQLGDDPFGLLETAAALTILKRHSWSSWDEFEQIFGIPLRVARVRGSDQEKQNVLNTMINSVKSQVLATGHNTEIQVIPGGQSDAFQVFAKKIEVVNKEMSKLVLGQTMTTDEGSSKSQSETHYKVQSAILKEDTLRLLAHINAFLPVLRQYGYPVPVTAEVRIVPATQTADDKISIDSVLLQSGVQLDTKYLEETYGVKIAGPTAIHQPGNTVPTANMDAIREIDHYYNLIENG